MDWREFWLWLHIFLAIAAFGPTFAFPFLGRMAQGEPEHGNFFLRATHMIGRRLIVPLALLVLVTGVVLILVSGWDLLANEWLLIAIGLYLISLTLSLTVQDSAVSRLIELSREPPRGPPPPEFLALTRRVRVVGILLSVNLLAIVLLMVSKPGAG